MTTITRGLAPTRFGQLHYRTAGDGTPVLLLSTNQQSSALYLELIDAIAGFSRPIAVDYPSHGMSDHIAQQPTIEDYADGMIDVLDALGIGRAVVVGEATGSAVAIDLAGRYPDRVERIVLINCPFPEKQPPTGDFIKEFESYRPADETGFPMTRTIEFMLRVNPRQSPMHPTQDWMDRINRAQIECGRDRWQALIALSDWDMRPALPRVSCPALFLTGEFFYHLPFHPEMIELMTGTSASDEVMPGMRINSGWEAAGLIGERLRGLLAG